MALVSSSFYYILMILSLFKYHPVKSSRQNLASCPLNSESSLSNCGWVYHGDPEFVDEDECPSHSECFELAKNGDEISFLVSTVGYSDIQISLDLRSRGIDISANQGCQIWAQSNNGDWEFIIALEANSRTSTYIIPLNGMSNVTELAISLLLASNGDDNRCWLNNVILSGEEVQYTSHPPTIPTMPPSFNPTISPTIYPTNIPIPEPSNAPTPDPTIQAIQSSRDPTPFPTLQFTTKPTIQKRDAIMSPYTIPTIEPTLQPTIEPTMEPTINPTSHPTVSPTPSPSVYPSMTPTYRPTTARPTASHGSDLVIDHKVTDDTTDTETSGSQALATDYPEGNVQNNLFNVGVNLNDNRHLLHLVYIGFILAGCCFCINCIFVGTYCHRKRNERKQSIIAQQYDVNRCMKQHVEIPSSSLQSLHNASVNQHRRQIDDFSLGTKPIPEDVARTLSPTISALTRLNVDNLMDALDGFAGGAESDVSAVGIRYRETNGMLEDEFEIRTSGSESPCNLPEGVQTVPESEFTGC